MVSTEECNKRWFNNLSPQMRKCISITYDILACITGFPQSPILWPLLFLIYVDDICQLVGNQNGNVFMDDTNLYSFLSSMWIIIFSLLWILQRNGIPQMY